MRAWLRPALTVLFLALLWHLGWADDCSSPEDAMDTLWIGPPLKGVMSAVIAVAVNGKTIMTKILTQPGTTKGDQKVPSFRLNAATQNRRTDLELDSGKGLWVYAWIQAVNPPPGYDAIAATAAIGVSHDECLEVSASQMTGARKAVYVKAVTSGGSPPSAATLTFSATLAGYPVSAPVSFTLGSGYRLQVVTRSEWA